MKKEHKKIFTLVIPSFTLPGNFIVILSLPFSASITALILNYIIIYIKAVVF